MTRLNTPTMDDPSYNAFGFSSEAEEIARPILERLASRILEIPE